jgi:hypothetical protein
MCGPAALPIAMFAVSAAQAVSSYQGQSAQAKAQEQTNQLQAGYINQARQDQMTQAQTHEGYLNDQASQKLQQSSMNERAASATLQTSAGENGVSGNSVSAIQRDYEQRQDDFATDVEYNRKADTDALNWQMRGFNTESQSRMNSLRQPVYPSLIATGLQIGGAALEQGQRLYNYNNPRTLQS